MWGNVKVLVNIANTLTGSSGPGREIFLYSETSSEKSIFRIALRVRTTDEEPAFSVSQLDRFIYSTYLLMYFHL